jgi:hypothetical protein
MGGNREEPAADRRQVPDVAKSIEDGIDALVCAWAGSAYLAGAATAYGDGHTAAIWIPS